MATSTTTHIRGRYAPSPTGDLHIGNARTALLAWLHVRSLGGTFVMRIEDLDRPRCVAGGSAGILEDLRWLGLDWDEGPDVGGARGPYLQSERTAIYDEALEKLAAAGLTFDCYCSRADFAAAASAPHGPADDGPRYPGTCRHLTDEAAAAKRAAGRKPSKRLRVEPGACSFEDGVAGRVAVDLSQSVGDFVVRRADGIHAYQLAAAVDDGLMGITHVLRGDDLLTSTPRQLHIIEALGLRAPRYAHVPLLFGPDGKRLSKRNGDTTVRWFREQGVRPERLVAELARSCGLTTEREIDARSLVASFDLAHIAREARPFDPDALL
ncbi:MAG: tRNA glutamyl-Q(34) synthetase GluQRS [Myxococcales bacterium]